MLVRPLTITLMLSFCSFIIVAQETYQVEEYQVNFFIKNAGITVEGRLDSLKAEVLFDYREPSNSQIIASVAPSTIQTGIKIRDKHLTRADYFDVAQYPIISLRSLNFTQKDQQTLLGRFELTIKNITQEITMPISYFYSDDILRLEGTCTINRLDFGLGEESLILADDVELRLTANLKQLKI